MEVLRPAEFWDIAVLLEFVGEYYAYDGIAFDAGRVRVGLEQLIADETLGRVWLIQQGGQGVGHAVLTYGFDLEFGGRVATLTEVYIGEAHRGRGLGKAVFRELEHFALEQGVFALELQVESDNLEAGGSTSA
ncbi:MAG TPA: GNAT family N-acetyltransferase [Meiothermus sp.]|nr:GNAT family N-acetyltransferase [Meiothermus sp.]